MKTALRPCCRALLVAFLASLILIGASHAQVSAPPGALRMWSDQMGHVSKASFVSANGTSVVLQLEDGTQRTVPLAILSKSDQAYIQQQKGQNAPPEATPGAPPGKPMTWPASVIIDPKALDIVTGKQDATQRQYQYDSGSFEFISNAPLANSVIKDVAIDFELIRALFEQLPWGWQPKPRAGPHFRVFLTETPEDFIALGGGDNSSGGSKDDYIYKKLSSLGLKKVGPRYAFDPRDQKDGEVLGLTFRLVMGEMRSLTYPWADMGMEELVREVAYHKETLRFTGLEKSLKDRIEAEAKRRVMADPDRLITYLHMPWKEIRSDVVSLRRQYYFDGMLLTYFFGFLDGDGKGTRLHEYYESIARDSLAWRAAKETNNGTPPPRDTPAKSLELLNTLLGDRTDAQLREEMIAKFRAIGVKL